MTDEQIQALNDAGRRGSAAGRAFYEQPMTPTPAAHKAMCDLGIAPPTAPPDGTRFERDGATWMYRDGHWWEVIGE